jgi:hypothetical protein
MSERFENLGRLHRRSASGGDCPSGESLSALAAGRAWPWQRRRLVRHLGNCADCSDDYRALLVARPGLRQALAEAAAGTHRGVPAIVRGGALVGAAVGALALVTVLVVDPSGTEPAQESGVLFASEFEPGPRADGERPPDEALFRSDFGDADRRSG